MGAFCVYYVLSHIDKKAARNIVKALLFFQLTPFAILFLIALLAIIIE